jgi:TetR/AcrR family transcriptional repressor of nem operon
MSHPRPHDTRHRLLEAASALIWESSYSSASVDAICHRAGVNKGSFYHFFPSKAELAVAALEAEWEARKPVWDACFSPLVPPLERFSRLHADCMAEQSRLAAQTGCVVGCPLFSLGSEIGTQNEPIRRKIDELLDLHLKYLESAIAEAHARRLIHAPNPAAKARIVLSYVEGQMTRARIQNDLAAIREIETGVLDILGVRDAAEAA